MSFSDSEIGPGSIVFEALQFLRENGETKLSALAAGLGRNPKRLTEQLRPGIEAGVLSQRINGSQLLWSVGKSPSRAAGPAADEDVREVVRVSAQAAPSIFAYADQRCAAPFAVSMSTDGRLGVERYGRVVLELTDEERRMVLKAASQGVIPS